MIGPVLSNIECQDDHHILRQISSLEEEDQSLVNNCEDGKASTQWKKVLASGS